MDDEEARCRNRDPVSRREDPIRRRRAESCDTPKLGGDLERVCAPEAPPSELVRCGPLAAESSGDPAGGIGAERRRVQRAGERRLVARRGQRWIERPAEIAQRDADRVRRRRDPDVETSPPARRPAARRREGDG
jgi:hypothetical protein